MDTSGVTVILSEKQVPNPKDALDKAKAIVAIDKANLTADAYAELIRRTTQI